MSLVTSLDYTCDDRIPTEYLVVFFFVTFILYHYLEA